MDIREADDDMLLEELKDRGFNIQIKVLAVELACYIGDKEFEVRAV